MRSRYSIEIMQHNRRRFGWCDGREGNRVWIGHRAGRVAEALRLQTARVHGQVGDGDGVMQRGLLDVAVAVSLPERHGRQMRCCGQVRR